MAVNLSPIGGVAGQFFDNNGNPLSGGRILTYSAGTTTPQATYTSASGATPHANPIILDAAGRVPGGEIWLTDGLQYKFIIQTSTSVQIGSYDNIIGINSNFVNFTNSQEIQTATAGQTVFTLTTMQYQPGTNSLSVFVDGVNQYGPGSQYAYEETSATVVTFVSGLHVGAQVKFTTSTTNSTSFGDAEQVSYTPPFVNSTATNVELKLAQAVSVKDFGAIGNGVADDTAAIQAALDASPVVLFPSGGTYVSAKLNVNSDVVLLGYGATLLHKANSAYSSGGGLLEMLGDNKLTIYGLKIDGNAANQSATAFTYNFVWCSIGSLEMYDCWCGNTKGTNIRLGNIDDFDASKFAHDVVINNCQLIMGLSDCGDNLRIERTHRATFSNNYVYGGFSSMRSQLYCKDLSFINNETSYAFADMGITTALSENVRIIANNIHHHFGLGIEIDAVVNCQVEGNYVHDNGLNGIQTAPLGAAYFANNPIWFGSIANGYGVNYSNQTFTSPYVNNINVTITNNVVTNNARADRLINSVDDFYAYNYVSNPNSSVNAQLAIEGAVITVGQPGFGLATSTSPTVVNNTFVLGSSDTQAILMGAYQYTARISGNFVKGNKRLAPEAAIGMLDLNETNKFLLDETKRSSLLVDTADAASKTGFAVTRTTTGSTNFPFKMFGSGQGSKLLRVVARVGAGTQAATIIPQLFDASGVFVGNLFSVAYPITLTTSYQEFVVPVPTSALVGNQINVTVNVPTAGVSVYFNEINMYMTES